MKIPQRTDQQRDWNRKVYPFQEYWHNLGYLLAAAPTNEVENQNWCAILIWDQFLIKFLAIRSSSSSSLSSQGFYVFTKLMWEILQSIEWLVRNSAQGGSSLLQEVVVRWYVRREILNKISAPAKDTFILWWSSRHCPEGRYVRKYRVLYPSQSILHFRLKRRRILQALAIIWRLMRWADGICFCSVLSVSGFKQLPWQVRRASARFCSLGWVDGGAVGCDLQADEQVPI